MAMVFGGIAGVIGSVGVTRSCCTAACSEPTHSRQHHQTSDNVLLVLLWLHLALGLATIPLSAQHLDGSMNDEAGRVGAAHRDLPQRWRAELLADASLGLQDCICSWA